MKYKLLSVALKGRLMELRVQTLGDGLVDGAFDVGERVANADGETFCDVGVERGDFLRERFGFLRPSAVEEPRDGAVVGAFDERVGDFG